MWHNNKCCHPKRLPTDSLRKQLRHGVHAQIAMFATVCLDGPRQSLNVTDKTEFNPRGCSTSCIDRNVIFRAATGHILLYNALSKSRMDTGWPRAIGSWLDALRGLAGRLAHIRRKAFHFSDLRASIHVTFGRRRYACLPYGPYRAVELGYNTSPA